jgi:hypothetical protein
LSHNCKNIMKRVPLCTLSEAYEHNKQLLMEQERDII